MTWWLSFEGDQGDVYAQFEAARKDAKVRGLPPLEQVDIGDTCNLVTAVAVKYGRVKGSAGGHWICVYNGAELDKKLSKFGALTVSINRCDDPESAFVTSIAHQPKPED